MSYKSILNQNFIVLSFILIMFQGCRNYQELSKISISCELPRMNFLYVGYDNPVNIVVYGYNPSKIDVSIDNGSITGSNGCYILRPENPGLAILTVSYKGNVIYQTTYRVKTNIIQGYAFLTEDSKIICISDKKGIVHLTKKDLLRTERIEVVSLNSDFHLNIKIIEFTMTTTSKDGAFLESTSFSNKLTESQLIQISEACETCKVYIENVKVLAIDGRILQLASICIYLTNEPK